MEYTMNCSTAYPNSCYVDLCPACGVRNSDNSAPLQITIEICPKKDKTKDKIKDKLKGVIEQMSELSAWELAECAKINFENVVKMNPIIGRHPIFILAMEQLDEAIKKIDIEGKELIEEKLKENKNGEKY